MIQWSGEGPRSVPDHDGRHPRQEVVETVLIVFLIVLLVVSVAWRGHSVQAHLDAGCRAGDPVSCRLDGRP